MPLDANDRADPARALRDRLRELHHRNCRTNLLAFATEILRPRGAYPAAASPQA